VTLPNSLLATLLYGHQPRVDTAMVCETLNAVFSPSGYAFTLEKAAGGLEILSHADVHIAFQRPPAPAPSSEFTTALDSKFLAIDGIDFHAITRGHRKQMRITVDTGPRPSDTAPSPDKATYELMLSLLQLAISAVISIDPPRLIHWTQSDQLLEPARFSLMEDMLFPLPLFLHPMIETSGRMFEDVQAVGFSLKGSEQIFGQPIQFLEAPEQLSWLLSRAYAFIEHCRATGTVFQDGDTFGLEPGEIILVRHRYDNGPDQPATITLTLRERDGRMVLQPVVKTAPPVAKPIEPTPPPQPTFASQINQEQSHLTPEERLQALSDARMEEERRRSNQRQISDHFISSLIGGKSILDLPYAHRSKAVWIMVGMSFIFMPIAGVLLAIYNKLRGPQYNITGYAMMAIALALLVFGGPLLVYSPFGMLMGEEAVAMMPGLIDPSALSAVQTF
jgi:hypothetical protein